MKFRARQTIGSYPRELSPDSAGAIVRELSERRAWIPRDIEHELYSLTVGGFREFAGPYGACWRVERVS